MSLQLQVSTGEIFSISLDSIAQYPDSFFDGLARHSLPGSVEPTNLTADELDMVLDFYNHGSWYVDQHVKNGQVPSNSEAKVEQLADFLLLPLIITYAQGEIEESDIEDLADMMEDFTLYNPRREKEEDLDESWMGLGY